MFVLDRKNVSRCEYGKICENIKHPHFQMFKSVCFEFFYIANWVLRQKFNHIFIEIRNLISFWKCYYIDAVGSQTTFTIMYFFLVPKCYLLPSTLFVIRIIIIFILFYQWEVKIEERTKHQLDTIYGC